MSLDTEQDVRKPVAADLASLYERMVRIRQLEDTVHRLFLNNEVEGTTHLYQGQEAVAVGVCDLLEPGDTVAATYRGHGACLAMGVDQAALLGEFLGRETGTNGGRGGSMNVIDLDHGVIGCFGIVGGSIAAATGAALASQLRKDGTVAVAFFGDGAVNQAYFHECLNFAGVRRLPIVYVCENNLYGEWTAMGAVTAGGSISRGRPPTGSPAWRSTATTSSPCATSPPRRSPGPAPARGPRSSRRRRTATRGIRASTPGSTGRRTRSTSGSAGIRFPAWRPSSTETSSLGSTSASAEELEQAVDRGARRRAADARDTASAYKGGDV